MPFGNSTSNLVTTGPRIVSLTIAYSPSGPVTLNSANLVIRASFKISNSYTYSDFKFDNYFVNDINLEGNYLPGIPKHNFKSEFNYFFSNRLVFKFQVQYFGELYTSDNNNNIEPIIP